MLRRWSPVTLLGLLPVLLLTTPASALTAKQKMETCKFGADDQKLTGSERKSFIARCMAKEPKDAAKKPAQAAAKPQ